MKPSIPRGTRDFGPQEMTRRNYIFDTIRDVFKLHGYLQIETPAMENLSTLTGKYGEEGDQLLFKILNSRLHESKEKENLQKAFDKTLQSATNTDVLTERALRYDLTVPFARYVVMHQNELTFPFKRYQIQNVWRADKPQKGRYREFYQCDADVIGSTSLLNEIDLLLIIDEVFGKLGLGVTIKLNNRKVLAGIAELIDAQDKIIDITVAIDKLDKIGEQKVLEELFAKGLSNEAIEKLKPIIFIQGNNESKLESLQKIIANDIGQKGIEELKYIVEKVGPMLSSNCKIETDITLARGLNYYTGAIIEVKVNDSRSEFTSSICGGGRYDDLTGIFGLANMSGVGISFGADRIYDVLMEANLFPNDVEFNTQVLFVNFGEAEQQYCLTLIKQLHAANMSAVMFPEQAKMKKQMGYADANKIPFVALIGSQELQDQTITIKQMSTGNQQCIAKSELVNFILKSK